MSQQIVINVDDPDDIIAGYGAGAVVRVERAADAAFSSPTELVTLPIVSGTTQYEYWDAAGLDGSWYRSRYSASGGAPFSGYSDPFQAGAPSTYATLDSLREYLNLPDNSRDNLLTDLLRQATDYLIGEMGRDLFRHPAVSGEETRLFNGPSSSMLDVREGIISLSGVRWSGGTGGEYTDLDAPSWVLYPQFRRPYIAVGGAQAVEPAAGIALTDIATVSTWFYGVDTVELTGVFGFPSIPSMVEKATLDCAREWYRQGPGGGGPVGVNQYGTPLFAAGMPMTVKKAIELYGVKSTWVVA